MTLKNRITGQAEPVIAEALKTQLRRIRHVALDMDGTIYNGSTLFPFTLPFLENLTRMGIGYSFLTNNPSKSRDEYLMHLEKMGIPATVEQVYTSALATIDYLKKYHPELKRLFILGTPGMIGEFEKAGFVSTRDDADDRPDAVIVSFDQTLVYARLCRAAWWISKKILYVATNPDNVCPTDKPLILVDCGSICACLEHATGRRPDIVAGKPDPRMLEGILRRHGLEPAQIAMAGDRIYTDIRMAYEAKALGVLVLSGETSLETALQSDIIPDIIAADIAGFGQMLMEAQKENQIPEH